jgi:superoxide reductase
MPRWPGPSKKEGLALAKRLEVYKCETCGNVVEVVNGGEGELVCCGEPMKLMSENTVDAAKEKHAPVIASEDVGIRVKVGDVPHPMEEKHYIQWMEVIADGKTYRQFLKPGAMPEAFFPVRASQLRVRKYRNLHGLRKAAA